MTLVDEFSIQRVGFAWVVLAEREMINRVRGVELRGVDRV